MENNEGKELGSSQSASNQVASQQPVVQDAQQTQEAVVQDSQDAQTEQQAQSVQAAQVQAQPQSLKTSALAIAGMVLGIVALVLVFIPVANFAAPILAIVGLILSIVGLQGVKKGKTSGKGIAIAGIVTCAVAAVITLLVIVACSSFLGSLTSNSKNQANASQFVGTWDVIEMTSDGKTYSEKDIETARKNGKDSFLVLEKDGKGILVLGGERGDGTWESASADSITFVFDANGQRASLRLKDGMLMASDMKFRKGSPRSSIPPAKSNSSSSSSSSASSKSSSASSSSSQIDPELKEFLDSYDAFADEYVEFMQEYKNSGYSTSMMNKYLDLTKRYSDFASKVTSWEKKAKSLSAADAAYFAEVSARVSKKLLEAM